MLRRHRAATAWRRDPRLRLCAPAGTGDACACQLTGRDLIGGRCIRCRPARRTATTDNPVIGRCPDRRSSMPVFRPLSTAGGADPPVCRMAADQASDITDGAGLPGGTLRPPPRRDAVATKVDHFKIATCP
jgi:hypothetical protein